MTYKTRLTYNTMNWQEPSGLQGKCPGGMNGSLWECNSGFGFEEWYRSELFQRTVAEQKWQYGYWQCFKNINNHNSGEYRDFSVYTRHCPSGCVGNNSGSWYEVAKYKKIVVLTNEERHEAVHYFADQLLNIRNQLQIINVDVINWFDEHPNNHPKLNIKFMLSDEHFVFGEQKTIDVPRGGGRFGLYQANL